MLRHFGQEFCIEALDGGSLRTRAYLEARQSSLSSTREVLDRAITKHRLEACVTPTGGPAGVIDTVNGDGGFNDGLSTMPAAIAGYPHITVPSGFIDHMPVGPSFFGPAWSDARLLGYGYAFEQATGAIRRPAL